MLEFLCNLNGEKLNLNINFNKQRITGLQSFNLEQFFLFLCQDCDLLYSDCFEVLKRQSCSLCPDSIIVVNFGAMELDLINYR